MKDYTTAINLSIGTPDAKFFNNRGIALKKLGELRKALKDFDRALRIEPANVVIMKNRQRILNALGDN